MRNLLTISTFALASVFFAPIAWAEPDGEKMVYKAVGDRAMHIYVTKPKDWDQSGNHPAIVFFHGGGWVGGEPGQFTDHAAYFASRGIVCFQVEYRLLDRQNSEPPEKCIADATDAFRWVRARAKKFGIDANRIASAGGSAGGHLAAYLGCVLPTEDGDDRVSAKSNAMLLFNPVYDNGPGGWGTKRVGDRYPEFSPMHNITKDDPPSVVFLGTKDKLIPVATGEKFRDQCEKLGIVSELHTYEGQPHGFFNAARSGGKYYYLTVKAADQFLGELGWVDGEPTIQQPKE